MRLNRVLLLAATINILIFALVFTISCADGADGKNGKDGKYCVVDGDWNILCDDTPVGKLEGKPGADGRPGKAGKDGDGCWLGAKTEYGSYDIICGTSESNGQYKGTLSGCVAQNLSKYEIVFTCGVNSVNICSGEVFDPAQQSCDTEYGTVLTEPKDYRGWCGRSRTEYDRRTQYCGYSEADTTEAAKKAGPTTVFTKCGGTDNIWHIDHQPNEFETGGYAKEYCRYYGPNRAWTAAPNDNPTDHCDTKPINKDSWKKEYCGYKTSTAVKRTVIEGACDNPYYSNRIDDPNNFGEGYYPGSSLVDPGDPDLSDMGYSPDDVITNFWRYGWVGPNQKAFGQGYCEVLPAHRKTGKTTYSENLCGTTSKNKVNNGKWNNEYCGFKDQNSVIWDAVYTGLCDDDKGPHRLKLKKDNGQDSILVKDYCSYKPDGKTELRIVCGTSGMPNKSKWNKEYCGVDATNPSKPWVIHNDLCDLGPYVAGDSYDDYIIAGGYALAPHTITFGSGNGNVIQYEYVNAPYSFRAYEDRTNETAKYGFDAPTLSYYTVGGTVVHPVSGNSIPTHNGDDKKGTKNTNYFKGYCKGLPVGKTALAHSLDTCFTSGSKKPNNGSWKKEYCGYKNTGAGGNNATKYGPIVNTENNVIFEDNYQAGYRPLNNSPNGFTLDGYTTKRFKLSGSLKSSDNPITLKADACEDGTGPNDGFANAYALVESTAGNTTIGLPPHISSAVSSSVITLKSASVYEPNNYCATVNLSVPGNPVILSKKTTAVKPCRNDKAEQPNKGKWNNEYCGYGTSTTTDLSKQSGLCGDGYGTKMFQSTGNNATNKWDGFCQLPGKIESDNVIETGLHTIFIPKSNLHVYAENDLGWNVSGYCVPNSTTNPSNWTKMNENIWRNQYCFTGVNCNAYAALATNNAVKNSEPAAYPTCTVAYTSGNKVETCPGNQYGRTDYKYNDPVAVRCWGATTYNCGTGSCRLFSKDYSSITDCPTGADSYEENGFGRCIIENAVLTSPSASCPAGTTRWHASNTGAWPATTGGYGGTGYYCRSGLRYNTAYGGTSIDCSDLTIAGSAVIPGSVFTDSYSTTNPVNGGSLCHVSSVTRNQCMAFTGAFSNKFSCTE
jgi:hypothetical protein